MFDDYSHFQNDLGGTIGKIIHCNEYLSNEYPYGGILESDCLHSFFEVSEGKALSQCTEAIFLFNGSCGSGLKTSALWGTLFKCLLISWFLIGSLVLNKSTELLILKVYIPLKGWLSELLVKPVLFFNRWYFHFLFFRFLSVNLGKLLRACKIL